MEKYLRKCHMANWDAESPVKIKRFERSRHLIKLFRYLQFCRGAEIGVHKGEYSLFICRRLPNVELLCVDPWVNYDYNRANEESVHNILDPENDFNEAKQRLAEYNVTFLRMTSMEALKEVPDESLDFVYIDGNHEFDYAMMDLIMWSKKVRPGGIVAGHDYCPSPNCDVKQAVNEYVLKNNITRWFLSGGDGSPSFFWRK